MSNNVAIHFGQKIIKRKYSFKLCKEEFALINTRPSFSFAFDNLINENAYTDETHSKYSLDWCSQYREICLKNYDYNMQYFQSLDKEEFNCELDAFLKRHSLFQEIESLDYCNNMCGYYILVIDEYKQAYIGKSTNIKRRIKEHWSSTKSFDRTLFPMYNEYSVFSIDFFRALDTTRIFIMEEDILWMMERELVEDFPQKFLTNRIGGDVNNGIMAYLTTNKHES